jgi:diguanylate cyclase (GGDEF)-like protein/PAS domain S-box-containing protein
MGAIGQFVLEQACMEAATWPEEIGLSINVTERQLADAAMPAIVTAALKTANLDSSRLELEVPEPVAMEHSAAVLASLVALRQTGVRIGIDGFGPAYAAHSYVPETTFDKIKISRSFIKNVAKDQGEASVVRAAIALCTSVGMTSCAVGVETKDQLATLVAEGCAQAQGRVFGPPLTARDIPAFLARLDGENAAAAPASAPAQGAVSFFQVVESANDAVIITTPELNPGPTIIYVNPAYTRLTGYEPREVIGLTPRFMQGPGTSRETLDRIRVGLSEGRTVTETVMNFAKNGAPYWADLRIVPMRDAEGRIAHFAAIKREVTTDRWRQEEIRYLSERDAITGIPNGAVLARAVEAEIARTEARAGSVGPCVVFVSVDDYAALNAEIGDPASHAVLQGVGDRLAENVRRCDAVYHISADIFAVCMRAVTNIDAQAIVANLCRAVAVAPFPTPSGPVPAKISVGLVAWRAGENAAALIHRADDSLRSAKSARLPSVAELAAE